MLQPFVRIVGLYLCGCLLASWAGSRPAFAVVSLVLGVVLIGVGWVTKAHPRIRPWLLAAAIVLLGAARMWVASTPESVEPGEGQEVSFEGHLAYQPQLAPESHAAVFIAQLQRGDQTAKVRVWLVSSDPLPDISYGAGYAGSGTLRPSSPQRNPGGYNQQRTLARQGIHAVLVADELKPVAESGGLWALRHVEVARQHIEQLLDTIVHHHPKHAAVLRGMLLGQRKQIPEEVLEPIQASGLLHLFAVSGLHVGFVAATIYVLVGFARPLSDRWRIGITMVVVLAYALLVGFRPSVVRATLMIELVLFAQWIHRDHDLLNLLALAACLLLVWNPLMLWDIGFQLSFLVTAAILVFVPKTWGWVQHRWQPSRIPALLLQSLLVSVAAQLASQPLIGYYFHRVYLYGPLANLVAALLAWWTIVTSLLAILGGLCWEPLAGFMGYTTQAGLELLMRFTAVVSRWPHAMLPVTHSMAIALFTLPVLAACIVFWRRWRAYWQWLPVGMIAWGVLLLWWGVWPAAFDGLDVTFLDVGQGDAICVQFPDGKVLLIDTGPRAVSYDAGESVVMPYLLHQNIRALDMVLITHPEGDHMGGLAHLQEHLRINEVVGDKEPPAIGTLKLTDMATIEVLHPDSAFGDTAASEPNNRSVVVRILYGEISFLFTGDIEQEAESYLCDHQLNLAATVLKLAHHGSRTSSTQSFLNAVHPRMAIASCGSDPRGNFPSVDVLTRLRDLGVHVFRTDQQGAIRIRTDGTRCWVETHIPHIPKL